MVKNAGSKNKRGRLMKNMKSPNSGLKYEFYGFSGDLIETIN